MTKVSKSKVEELIKMYASTSKIIRYELKNGKVVEIEVFSTVSHKDFERAVREASEMHFAIDEMGREVYAPYLDVFALNYTILKYFTNINVDILNGLGEVDSKSEERLWDLMCSPVMSDVLRHISAALLADMKKAIDTMVYEKKESLRPGAAKLWNDLDQLVSAYKEQIGEIGSEDIADFKTLVDRLENIGDESIVSAITR